MPAAEILPGRRVVATPAALAAASFPAGALLLWIAADDVLVIGDGPVELSDEHAIIEDDRGWCAVRMPEEEALRILARRAAWDPSPDRPVLAQGIVAGLAAKVYLDGPGSLIMVAAPFAAELEKRLP